MNPLKQQYLREEVKYLLDNDFIEPSQSDFTSRTYLCSALIQCHLDYSCSSWYLSLNKCLQNKLQINVCQNKIVRFINGMGPRDSVNNHSIDDMSLLNVESRTT